MIPVDEYISESGVRPFQDGRPLHDLLINAPFEIPRKMKSVTFFLEARQPYRDLKQACKKKINKQIQVRWTHIPRRYHIHTSFDIVLIINKDSISIIIYVCAPISPSVSISTMMNLFEKTFHEAVMEQQTCFLNS